MKAIQRRQSKPLKPLPKPHGVDFLLLLFILMICALGLVMMFSASYYYGITSKGDGLFFLKRQMAFFAIGIAGMTAAAIIPYRFFRKGWVMIALYAAAIASLAATLKWGTSILGAKRWLDIGFFSLQPSELCKVVLIMTWAGIMSRTVNMQHLIVGVLPCVLAVAPPVVLILLQPNMSMAAILCVLMYIMLYIGGTMRSHRLALLVVGIGMALLLILLKGYRAERLFGFLDQNSDLLGRNYQLNQAKIALGSGGFFGQGLSFSRQKLGFLPERENDYILAIIGEELGFAGILGLLSMYMAVIWRSVKVAMNAFDRYGRLLSAGIASVLAVQVILNVAVVSGAMPTTGQTLPFISYGGTSMVVFLTAMGLILSVSRYTKVTTKNAGPKQQE
ncbi:MAG: cell division protein FtsW [Clostridia bacterium]|nr:cell division protein FtsW [Clostridia bacterium]